MIGMAVDILIVDDESDICELVSGILEDEGYATRTVTTGIDALTAIRERQPGLVLLDVWLGDGAKDGLAILECIKRDHPYVPVVMMSGHGTVETAVSAIKLGAYDFIEKPFQSDRLLLVVKRAIESSKLKRENDELRVRAPFLCSLVGTSHDVQEIKQKIDSIAPTNSRICIHGPIGCDRASIARYIHNLSLRADQPFLSVNCLSVPITQIEMELFGFDPLSPDQTDHRLVYKEESRKIGLLERAHGGTLFIDEISVLPSSVQAHLIHFLQHGNFVRMGQPQSVSVDVRLIVGTSQTDTELLNSPTFSNELYYRVNAASITVPPLSERTRDIPLLAKQYLTAIANAQNIPIKQLSEEAMTILESYPWPGDVQQLKNVLEWSIILATNNGSPLIGLDDLPPEIIRGNEFTKTWQKKSSVMATLPIKDAREIFEREYLQSQIRRFNGNVSQTAKFIGMDRAALHRKIKALDVGTRRERAQNTEESAFDE